MKVLYDGWPLAREPVSPAGLHLIALLEHLPQDIQPVIAFPQPAPPWLSDYRVYPIPTPATDAGRLIWEQRVLPGIARRISASILHLTVPRAPILGPACVVSPADFLVGRRFLRDAGPGKVFDRLRDSFGVGGLTRAARILWPVDFPLPGLSLPVYRLAPIVPRRFHPRTAPNGHGDRRQRLARLFEGEFPESFVLYHGPTSPKYLQQLIATWSRAAGPIGAYHPLLVVVPTKNDQIKVKMLAEAAHLGGSLSAIADVPLQFLPWLYQECSAIFHPVPALSPWGGSIHHGLACGKAIVAAENPQSDAMVGPAAYLIPPDDPRRLAAALITVVVEEDVRVNLENAARRRSDEWGSARFSSQLNSHYREISGEKP